MHIYIHTYTYTVLIQRVHGSGEFCELLKTMYTYDRSPHDLPHEGHAGIEETDRVASMSPQDNPGRERHF